MPGTCIWRLKVPGFIKDISLGLRNRLFLFILSIFALSNINDENKFLNGRMFILILQYTHYTIVTVFESYIEKKKCFYNSRIKILDVHNFQWK